MLASLFNSHWIFLWERVCIAQVLGLDVVTGSLYDEIAFLSRCGKDELREKRAFVWIIINIGIYFSYLCLFFLLILGILVKDSIWLLCGTFPSRYCNADFVSELNLLWLGLVPYLVFNFWAPLTRNQYVVCLNTASNCYFLITVLKVLCFCLSFSPSSHWLCPCPLSIHIFSL